MFAALIDTVDAALNGKAAEGDLEGFFCIQYFDTAAVLGVFDLVLAEGVDTRHDRFVL